MNKTSLVEKDRADAARSASWSTAERELRVNLAASYRVIAHLGLDDGIETHISVRVPGPQHHFLLNPFGTLYEEITASMLIKVDLDGNIVDQGSTSFGVNKAGFVIHSALHAARDDAQAIFHCHTPAGTAVSAQKDGLLPIGPAAMLLLGKIGYHDFEGVTTVNDEKPRLVRDFGDNWSMILRNHGTLTVGNTLQLAFLRMLWLEKACAQQVAALAGGRELTLPDPAMATKVQGQQKLDFSNQADLAWQAQVRRIDRIDTSYRL